QMGGKRFRASGRSGFRPRILRLHKGNVALGRKGADGVLVYHLLAAVAVDDDGEIVECAHHAPDLESVRQIYGNGYAVLAQLVEERVLDVDGFVHGPDTPIAKELGCCSILFAVWHKLSCYYITSFKVKVFLFFSRVHPD